MAHATRADLMAYLADLGIETRTLDHQPVFTVAESDLVNRDLPGGHTKNLFLKDAKDKLWLVTAEAHARVDLKALKDMIGSAKLSFGKPDLLAEVLGVTPGSVTALALINDTAGRVTAVLDQTLVESEIVNCHPLTNAATTAIASADLLRFLKATGHDPIIVRLGT